MGLAEFQAWRLAEAVSVCFVGAAVRTESRVQACGGTHTKIFRGVQKPKKLGGFRDNPPFQLHWDFVGHLVNLRQTKVPHLII